MQFRQSLIINTIRMPVIVAVVVATLVLAGTIPDALAAGELTIEPEIGLKLVYLAKAMRSGKENDLTLTKMRRSDIGNTGTQLSWRVHLLPAIGENDLYERFHFGEPWDSDHNQSLLAEMPEAYRLGSSRSSKTRFQVITGKQSLFGRDKNLSLSQIRDGAAETVLIAVTDVANAVPWTKPDESWFGEEPASSSLGKTTNYTFVMADAQLLTLPASVVDKELPALVTHNGRESVDMAALRSQYGPQPERDSGADATGKLSVRTKLRSLCLAMHKYHESHRGFPPQRADAAFDKNQRPKLSWRVHLLPMLGQQSLYQQFKLDEQWDSDHNLRLLDRMPEVYRSESDLVGTNTTRIATFTGKDAPFPASGSGYHLSQIRDPVASTIMLAELGVDRAMPWTKPVDAEFDLLDPKKCLGTTSQSGIRCVTFYGNFWNLDAEISSAMFASMITPRGGENYNGAEWKYFTGQ